MNFATWEVSFVTYDGDEKTIRLRTRGPNMLPSTAQPIFRREGAGPRSIHKVELIGCEFMPCAASMLPREKPEFVAAIS
jgi:hypothetical protein